MGVGCGSDDVCVSVCACVCVCWVVAGRFVCFGVLAERWSVGMCVSACVCACQCWVGAGRCVCVGVCVCVPVLGGGRSVYVCLVGGGRWVGGCARGVLVGGRHGVWCMVSQSVRLG